MAGHDPKPTAELRKFGLALGGGLTVLGGLLWWRGLAVAPYLWGVAAVLWLLALAAPRLLAPLERVLAAVFRAVAAAITQVVLVIVFFLVLTPIALLVRLLGTQLLSKRFDRQQESYWLRVPPDGPWSRPTKPF